MAQLYVVCWPPATCPVHVTAGPAQEVCLAPRTLWLAIVISVVSHGADKPSTPSRTVSQSERVAERKGCHRTFRTFLKYGTFCSAEGRAEEKAAQNRLKNRAAAGPKSQRQS